MPALYGLIGYPLTHSFSPAYFKKKFEKHNIDAAYEKYEFADISFFPTLIKNNPELKGLNVTIPHKTSIISCLDKLDDAAKEIGAVNCIDIRDGKLKGYNTDVIGFEESLFPLLKPFHKKALILGTGGSSQAVKYVLKKLKIEALSVSRNKKEDVIIYEELDNEAMKEHLLIINTTPIGMYPNVDSCPDIPYHFLTKDHLLYDLIYNPAETKFLRLGKEKGSVVKNGLEMLQLQADASWGIWNR
ncbi:MAG TPA: shikimate dehydrogenase [Flavipsychrobacter sp.]|nr:shikimate dehydrogenase [Flavipsychrobacter sp.]